MSSTRLTGHDLTHGIEYRVTTDRDLISGRELARIEYRLDSAKRRWWTRFLVVLDDETTLETVYENLDELIAAHRRQA